MIDLKIGDVVYVPGYYVTGVLIGIMGIYCRVKCIGHCENTIDIVDTRLSHVFLIEPQDWTGDICPWERRAK